VRRNRGHEDDAGQGGSKRGAWPWLNLAEDVQKATGRRRGHARRLRVEGGEHEPGRAGGAEPDIEDDAPGVVDVEPDRERVGGQGSLQGRADAGEVGVEPVRRVRV
jgi:hypothetical protein